MEQPHIVSRNGVDVFFAIKRLVLLAFSFTTLLAAGAVSTSSGLSSTGRPTNLLESFFARICSKLARAANPLLQLVVSGVLVTPPLPRAAMVAGGFFFLQLPLSNSAGIRIAPIALRR